jgi:Ca2+/Na+ antiporter
MNSNQNKYNTTVNDIHPSYYPSVLHGALMFIAFMMSIISLKDGNLSLAISGLLITALLAVFTFMSFNQIRNAKIEMQFAEADSKLEDRV